MLNYTLAGILQIYIVNFEKYYIHNLHTLIIYKNIFVEPFSLIKNASRIIFSLLICMNKEQEFC